MPRRVGRLTLALLGAALAVLSAVGAHSLLTGESSLVGGARAERDGFWADDLERIRSGESSAGPFVASRDPLVSYRLRSRLASEHLQTFMETDGLGLRKRLGPPAEEGATRIAIVGDSVAFGQGVEGDQTFAHHLEEFLARTMEAGSPRPVVRTVACPGWTLENSVRYFLDVYPRLRSDIVVFVPVANDLDDSSAVNELGLLREYGAEVRDPRYPPIGLTTSYYFVSTVEERIGRSELDRRSPGAMYVHLHGGVTHESRRRYDAAVTTLYDLQSRLELRGGKLLLAPLERTLFNERLLQLVRGAGDGIPVLPGMKSIRAEDRLEDNQHTNGVFHRAAAWRFAEFLLEHEWIPGADRARLPPEDERYRDNRRELLDDAATAEQVAEVERLARASLGPRVDLRDGTGCKQVYGGIWPDGGVGISFLLALGNHAGGTELRLEIERLRRAPGLDPLELTVELDGRSVTTLEVPPPGDGATRSEHVIPLPPEFRDEPYLDLLVVSSSWLLDEYRGVRRLHAYDFVAAEVR